MGKINTPLMALIDELKLERIALLKLMQPAGQYDRAIYIAESLLQTEREVIVKTYAAGQDNYRKFTLDRLNNRLTYDEQYFNETFKSYE